MSGHRARLMEKVLAIFGHRLSLAMTILFFLSRCGCPMRACDAFTFTAVSAARREMM